MRYGSYRTHAPKECPHMARIVVDVMLKPEILDP
ncbi:MAG: phosphoribosylformylglycinamidine synthase, partial [Corynebacterium propinquum]